MQLTANEGADIDLLYLSELQTPWQGKNSYDLFQYTQ